MKVSSVFASVIFFVRADFCLLSSQWKSVFAILRRKARI